MLSRSALKTSIATSLNCCRSVFFFFSHSYHLSAWPMYSQFIRLFHRIVKRHVCSEEFAKHEQASCVHRSLRTRSPDAFVHSSAVCNQRFDLSTKLFEIAYAECSFWLHHLPHFLQCFVQFHCTISFHISHQPRYPRNGCHFFCFLLKYINF